MMRIALVAAFVATVASTFWFTWSLEMTLGLLSYFLFGAAVYLLAAIVDKLGRRSAVQTVMQTIIVNTPHELLEQARKLLKQIEEIGQTLRPSYEQELAALKKRGKRRKRGGVPMVTPIGDLLDKLENVEGELEAMLRGEPIMRPIEDILSETRSLVAQAGPDIVVTPPAVTEPDPQHAGGEHGDGDLDLPPTPALGADGGDSEFGHDLARPRG